MIISKTRNANGWVTHRGNLIPNEVKCNKNRNWVSVLRLNLRLPYVVSIDFWQYKVEVIIVCILRLKISFLCLSFFNNCNCSKFQVILPHYSKYPFTCILDPILVTSIYFSFMEIPILMIQNLNVWDQISVHFYKALQVLEKYSWLDKKITWFVVLKHERSTMTQDKAVQENRQKFKKCTVCKGEGSDLSSTQ